MRKSALVAFGLVVAVIVALGLTILLSAGEPNGVRIHRNPYFFINRQLIYAGLGIVIATVTALVDYHRWRDYPVLTWLFYGTVFLLLLAVFPPLGHRVNGSFRWIDLGFFNLQPSEFAKLSIVIMLAVWLDKAGWRVELFKRGVLWPMVLIGAYALPVVFETDFGSTVVIAAVGCLIMLVAGVRLLHMAPFVLLGAAGFVVKVCQDKNRMARIFAWLGFKINIGAEVMDQAAKNAEHQGNMALAAISNGGTWGVGLNQSMQKHDYLPEAHTDMIFAVGAEELGLPFSIGTFALFIAFFALSVYIAHKASDRFGRLLVVGMSFVIFFAAMFNIGVVCEALPMKGMALPFFSYGGTNMVCAFFAVGTILSVGLHSYRDSRKRKVPHG